MVAKGQRLEIQRRLENWNRWMHGDSRASVSPYPAYRLYLGGDLAKSGNGLPLLVGEAEDTDKILRRMNPALSEPLTYEYLRRGTQAQKATRLKISRATFCRHLARAEVLFSMAAHPSACGARPAPLPDGGLAGLIAEKA